MLHTTKKSMPYIEQDACAEGNDLLRKDNGVSWLITCTYNRKSSKV